MKTIHYQGHQVACLQGARNFGFLVAVLWPDLVLLSPSGGPVEVTFFGGTATQDPGDNGLTASGARTRNEDGSENPILGCALPVMIGPRSGTQGSPLPVLPWRTPVKFYNTENGKEATFDLVDNGPAYGTNHGADLTRTASKQMTGGEPDSIHCDVRIIGGAHYLSDDILNELREQGLVPSA